MFNRKYIFKGSMFHCHVRLPECIFSYGFIQWWIQWVEVKKSTTKTTPSTSTYTLEVGGFSPPFQTNGGETFWMMINQQTWNGGWRVIVATNLFLKKVPEKKETKRALSAYLWWSSIPTWISWDFSSGSKSTVFVVNLLICGLVLWDEKFWVPNWGITSSLHFRGTKPPNHHQTPEPLADQKITKKNKLKHVLRWNNSN